MNKKIFGISLAAVMVLSAGLLGACQGNEGKGNNADGPYVMPGWSGMKKDDALVAVHDPSIFYDEASSTYYAFGTHFAVASSTDLMNWTQLAIDNQWQKLYGNASFEDSYGTEWPATLRDSVNEVKPASSGSKAITTTWAPDVEEYNGTYYMYYSLTKSFGSSESVIGRVEAESPMGPYINNEIILSSVGVTESGKPNCIDPELFYDKDGRLWMVYGSSYGGLYIKELYNSGDNWGLPKEEGVNNYGKKLWSGSNNQEGPFIFYNEDTGYYYMMVSYGDFNTNYNMRVARSENPDGPYVDITGADVANVTGQAGGNKIAGNYIMGDANGYAAIGHNSVLTKDGKYYVVAHVRRQSGTGVTPDHHLYVFQLFFNEDGWPVMNPNRYAAEAVGTGVTMEKAAGTYDVVLHSEGTVVDFVQSQEYTFNADGTVTDATAANIGSWTLTGDYYVNITLTGGDWAGTYKGVVAPGWDMYVTDYTEAFATFSFTAISETGRPLWAVGTTAKS